MIKMMRHIPIILAAAFSMLSVIPCQAADPVKLYCRISTIYINDTLVYEGQGEPPELLNLKQGKNKLAIELDSRIECEDNSLANSATEFSARLANYDHGWSQWSTQKVYTYHNITPGEYIFQAKARIDESIVTAPMQVNIKVRSQIWKSGLGLTTILLIISSATAAAAIILWRRQSSELSKTRAELKKCMNNLKTTTEKLNSQEESHNKNIQVLSLLSKAGQNIIKNFSLKEIYKTTYNEINKFFETDNIGIGIYNGPHNSLDFCSFIMNGEAMPFARYSLEHENNMEVFCYLNNKTIVMDDYCKQAFSYLDSSKYRIDMMMSGSAVYLPLFDNEMTIGLLTIHNKAKNYFNSYHMGIIRNIASYLETAIVNFHTDRKAKRKQKLLEEKTINLQKTNNEYEKSQAQLQTMSVALTNTENSVVILDSNGNLIWGNKGFTKLYGYNFDDYIKDSAYYMDAIRQRDSIQYFTRSFEKVESVSFSLPHKNMHGNEIWTQSTLTPIVDKNGKLIQVVAVDTDISSLKSAENEITKQRNEIELKNKDLTKSIEYASTIQTALMPSHAQLRKIFPMCFLMILPKDIVSGDFFWMGEKFGRKYLAHCDCAGHGVPGAFLSMMGKVFLDEILQNLKLEHQPSDIIRMLNDKIYESINGLQNKVGGIDGMDMALCMINSRNTVLIFAGAYRPLYMVRDGILTVTNGDKTSVGNISPYDDFQWENHQLMIRENDFLLMCSDGYADQFGHENGKKMGRRQFSNLITEAAKLEKPEEIEKFFLDSLTEWRGNQEQVDDVSLSGFRITAFDNDTLQYDDDEED